MKIPVRGPFSYGFKPVAILQHKKVQISILSHPGMAQVPPDLSFTINRNTIPETIFQVISHSCTGSRGEGEEKP